MSIEKQLINFNLSEIADGGAWKIEAMNSIKEYLEGEFSDEISDGHIVVIA